jgi:DDE superfamily endonuclease
LAAPHWLSRPRGEQARTGLGRPAGQLALSVLSAPAPTPEVSRQLGLRHKTVPQRARQMILVVRRWLPGGEVTVIGDQTYRVHELGGACARWGVRLLAPLRLDAALYAPVPPRRPSTNGRPRVQGKRLPQLKQVLKEGQTIWHRVRRFVHRWTIETTFEESRAHLGLKTQRQWSDQAMARTTLCLFGLYSVVALLAHALPPDGKIPVRRTAWYHKSQATFGDVLAVVRQHFWGTLRYSTSAHDPDLVEIPWADLYRLAQAVCYAH